MNSVHSFPTRRSSDLGLFSAGNDVAEFYNNSYPLIEGVSLGSAFNGGRMIGEQAAELAKAK